MRLEGVTKIPPSGYFGISAATGGLSGTCIANTLFTILIWCHTDDHDVLSYVVHTLTPLENLRGKVSAYITSLIYRGWSSDDVITCNFYL